MRELLNVVRDKIQKQREFRGQLMSGQDSGMDINQTARINSEAGVINIFGKAFVSNLSWNAMQNLDIK